MFSIIALLMTYVLAIITKKLGEFWRQFVTIYYH